jgi:hypothetical protein
VWCCALPLLGLIAFAIEMASIEVRDEHRIENWVSAHQVVLIVGWGLPALLITCAPLLCDYNSEARCRRRLGRPRPGVWTKDEFRKRTGADRQPAIRLSQHRCEHCSGIVYFTDQERGGPVACQRCGRLCEIPALSEGA